ncbi:hypothetical protein Droror1_Dr00027218 [Drosera rotundifolia]
MLNCCSQFLTLNFPGRRLSSKTGTLFIFTPQAKKSSSTSIPRHCRSSSSAAAAPPLIPQLVRSLSSQLPCISHLDFVSFRMFWVWDNSTTRWSLVKNRLVAACPSCFSAFEISYYDTEQQGTKPPTVFLLKFCCNDRPGLLHNVTKSLCELELTIKRVKVSTTPDGRVVDLFFITDTWEQLHTKKRQEDTYEHIKEVNSDENRGGAPVAPNGASMRMRFVIKRVFKRDGEGRVNNRVGDGAGSIRPKLAPLPLLSPVSNSLVR